MKNENEVKENNKYNKYIIGIISIVVFLVIIIICISASNSDYNYDYSNKSKENTTIEKEQTSEEKWENYYKENSIEISELSQNILFEYGEYYVGKTVLTVVNPKNIYSTSVKANVKEDSSLFYDLVFNFNDKDELLEYRNYSEENDDDSNSNDEMLIIVGEVKSKSTSWGDTVTIENCHVIGSKEKAKEKNQQLLNNIDNQKNISEQIKADKIRKDQEALIAKRNEYISKCGVADYNDVLRYPTKYEDKYIYVNGRVIQISEGWFDSVTIRLNDSSNNTWYIKYSYENDNEPRIIENDNITVYGESTGTTSYTAVLGNQVTLPSIKAKYIIIN